MLFRHFGYAAKNLTLDLTTGRTLRLKSLAPERLDEVVHANLDALQAILRWNAARDIRFFRISSDLIPFASHPAMPLDWEARYGPRLEEIGAYARAEELRLTMHPSQYIVLSSPDAGVRARSRAELEYHARVLCRLGAPESSMTLHLGGAYGDRPAAMARFAEAFAELSPEARGFLILENDDRTYRADEALALAEALGVPLVFDFHHHRLNPTPGAPGDLSALLRGALASWGARVPKVHLSSAREPGTTAHADFLDEADLAAAGEALAGVADGPVDAMLEAKAKDRALLRLRGTPAFRRWARPPLLD